MVSRRIALMAASILAGAAVSLVPATQASASTSCSTHVIRGSHHINVPANAAGSTTTCFLVNGLAGSGVTALQDALVFCYGKDLNGSSAGKGIDGIFGNHTETALSQVQSAIGARSDGQYGPQTHSLMRFMSEDNVNTCFLD